MTIKHLKVFQTMTLLNWGITRQRNTCYSDWISFVGNMKIMKSFWFIEKSCSQLTQRSPSQIFATSVNTVCPHLQLDEAMVENIGIALAIQSISNFNAIKARLWNKKYTEVALINLQETYTVVFKFFLNGHLRRAHKLCVIMYFTQQYI